MLQIPRDKNTVFSQTDPLRRAVPAPCCACAVLCLLHLPTALG
jgi:hypothetical protein